MTPKALTTLTTTLLAAAMLAGCAQDDVADDTAMAPPAATAPDPTTPDPAMDPDATQTEAMAPGGSQERSETLALVMAVDEHEIAAAEQARDKDVEGEVMEFADMLHTEHTANLEATRQLMRETPGTMTDMPEVQAQREAGQAALDELAELDGEEYERAFVDAMVEGHRDALSMLDGRTPDGADEQMRRHMTSTREAIERHIEHGEQLQADME